VSKPSPGEALLQSGRLDELQGIVNLVREIPNSLIHVSTDRYAEVVLAMTIIEENVKFRFSREYQFPPRAIKGVDLATAMYQILRDCPDTFPPSSSTSLVFVDDEELPENIRDDVGAIERALSNSEWKAATVLAGSAIEALLL
jgi:hypothetical protein